MSPKTEKKYNPKLILKTHSRNTFLTKKTPLKKVLQKQPLHFSMIPFSLKIFSYLIFFLLSKSSKKITLFNNPKLSPNSHSRYTFFNHFLTKKEYGGKEYLILTNLRYFYAVLYTLILCQAFNNTLF